MTIDAGWLKAWKKESAAAFSPKCRHPVDVVFIDGQIKLMKAMGIATWKELVYWNFASPVKRHFAAGAHTVVVAFDDYALVPAAKGMTQARRVKHVQKVDVHANETLPATIPANWAVLMMNRAFKTKVIAMITAALPALVPLGRGQRLIIDHRGHPVCHSGDGEPTELEDLPPAGEADVKAMRYARLGRLLIEATDGDYVPIALLHLERAGADAADVSILRMEVNLRGPKRNAAGDVRYGYEHLHANTLLAQLRGAVLQKLRNRRERLGAAAGREMRVLAALVTYTGCDFSKGLPFLSPQRIWDNLGLVWDALAGALAPDADALAPDAVCDRALARLYCVAYARHAPREPRSMAEVAERLKRRSALAESVRARLPEAASVACVVANGNWVLAYWTGLAPDVLAGPYGFARDARGRVCWADEAGAAAEAAGAAADV
jgi:hypothetical protein